MECNFENCPNFERLGKKFADRISELEQENAELKAENERLKQEIKEVKKYQYEQEYLEKEIEEIQKALKTLAEGLNKRQILLQEIKEFCKKEIEYFDNSDDYGQQADWIALLQKITKAEEE